MSHKRSREEADLPEDPGGDLLLGTQESSLFELQVDELLNGARLDYVREDDVEEAIAKLSACLREIPKKVISVPKGEAARYLECMGMSQRSLRFAPPERVYAVGGWACRTVAKPNRTVDLAMQMPSSCFDEKDQLNNRYFARRAQYLAEAAAALRRNPAFADVSWDFLQHDARRPVLVITLQRAGAESCAVRLLPVLAPGTFPLAKLATERNNLRASSGPAAAGKAGADKDAPALPPTPHYNAAVIQDMVVDTQHQVLQDAVKAHPELSDAIILLKVWARAQGFAGQPDSLDGFLLSMLAAHLAATGSLVHAMKPLQMMRAVLNALRQPSLFSKGTAMQRRPPTESAGSASPPSPAAFRRHHAAVFVDPSGHLNLAAHLSKSALAEVQSAARHGLRLLDQAADQEAAFADLFLTRHTPTLTYDAFWRISAPLEGSSNYQLSDVPPHRRMEARVEGLAQQALGTRARLVRAFRGRLHGGPSLEAASLAPSSFSVLVAAQLDTDEALRAVDMGPPAESPKAAAFREFWGDRAELRRYKDGNIAESVVWECGPSERHLIADRAMLYALNRHLGSACTVSGHAGLLDAVMHRRDAHSDKQATARRQIEAAILKLGKQLRSVSSLPLKIVAVQPLSAAARHTAAFPPLPHPFAGGQRADSSAKADRCLNTIDLLAQLEGSGKWPDHPHAYAKAKAAMGCQLADELASGYGLHAHASEHCCDVLAEGFAFRIFLASERDSAMANVPSAAEADEADLPRPEAMLARAAQHAGLRQRAKHHAMLAALSGAAPAFPAAAQLASRWASTHMLSNHITEPISELLMAAAFSADRGASIPGSRTSGFIRFLHLLSTYPWREQALIVDPTAELADADREAAVAAHSKARREGMAPAMCIVPAYSTGDWLGNGLSPSVVHRASALAQRSISVMQEKVEGSLLTAGAVRAAVFTPALADFDALLQLSRDALAMAPCAVLSHNAQRAAAEQQGFSSASHVLPLPCMNEGSKRPRAMLKAVPQELVAKRKQSTLKRDLLLGFKPVELFVESIEQRYGDVATVCADFLGGSLIGIKWRSSVQQAHELSIQTAHAVSPAPATQAKSVARSNKAAKRQSMQKEPAAAVALDAASCIAEILVMGSGLVEGVLVRTE